LTQKVEEREREREGEGMREEGRQRGVVLIEVV
jgi:hypothetical protein